MTKNIFGGGSRTNINGLRFEQETDLVTALLAIDGYEVHGCQVYYRGAKVGEIAGKHDLYRVLLEPRGVDYRTIVSKRLLPDEALYVLESQTVYVIEKKFQHGAGSVDEKLQTCSFKKRQYERLFSETGIGVEYLYVLNDWFKDKSYRDVLEYIVDTGCHYCFNEIPLSSLGLPHADSSGASHADASPKPFDDSRF